MSSYAYEFYEAAKELESKHLIPATVNIAFCCELYLKELCTKESKNINRIHHIKELYNMLSMKRKHEIREAANIYNFEGFLDEIDNAFVEWRYAYENQGLSISLSDCFRFAEALKIQCKHF